MLDGEQAIIQRAVRGEASAFGLLYDHYQPKIYRFVLIKVSHREEAEDLTHQVFLHAWQKIESYEHMGFPFSSWLYQIARNQVIDHYRTKKTIISIEDTDEEKFAVDETHTNDLQVKLEMERVMKAIRQLKLDYQDVIIMRFVDELSPSEVASVLKKSEGAIKLMQHRAMQQLKKILQNQ